jgi:hypothetical protein
MSAHIKNLCYRHVASALPFGALSGICDDLTIQGMKDAEESAISGG